MPLYLGVDGHGEMHEALFNLVPSCIHDIALQYGTLRPFLIDIEDDKSKSSSLAVDVVKRSLHQATSKGALFQIK